MSVYVHDLAEQQQAESELLAADLVEHFTRRGCRARQIQLGRYPGLALWCPDGTSAVVLVDDDLVQWGSAWQHLVRRSNTSTRQIADRVLATTQHHPAQA